MTQNVFCNNGHRLDESPSLPVADRKPCPTCGSMGRHAQVVFTDTVTVRDSVSLRAKPDVGKPFMTQKIGASWWRKMQKWMHVEQVVDRRGNRYRKKIVDPETGEVLRDDDAPLTDHQGHGSKARRDGRNST